jgi:hypothetical protein
MKKTKSMNIYLTRLIAALLSVTLCFGISWIPASAATTIKQNVSSTALSSSSGSLPASATVYASGSYYFNVQFGSNTKVKSASLYVKYPGASSYTKLHTETANNYFRYAYVKKGVGSTAGTLSYYWSYTLTSGTTSKTSVSSITVKASSTTSVEKQVQARLTSIINGEYDTSSRVLSANHTFKGSRASAQCKGYAQTVFELCFGIVPGATITTGADRYLLKNVSGITKTASLTSVTSTSVKNFFTNYAKPGDFVQMQKKSSSTSPHSAIVYSVDSTGVWWLEANVMATTYGSNYIVYRHRTWSQLASDWGKMSIYHATSYTLTQ